MVRTGIFIVDANVLIDFVETDATVLTAIVDALGPVHVPYRILQEIRTDQLDEEEAVRLGLTVVIEEVEELQGAAIACRTGPLSFQDHLVLIMARRRSWIPITNDRSLRTKLEGEKIPMRWGLEMLVDLVRAKAMTSVKAMATAAAVTEANPRYGKNILTAFREKLKSVSAQPRTK